MLIDKPINHPNMVHWHFDPCYRLHISSTLDPTFPCKSKSLVIESFSDELKTIEKKRGNSRMYLPSETEAVREGKKNMR